MSEFAREYWRRWQDSGSVRRTEWRGVPMIKSPIDCYLFAEAIHQTRPQVIVETGTAWGGSALMLRDFGETGCMVVSIDVHKTAIRARGVSFIEGSSVDHTTVRDIDQFVHHKRTMVVLDSDHSYGHVHDELEAYREMVTPGCYLVVEDTNDEDTGQGAGKAAREFAEAWPHEFTEDEAMSRFGVTFNTWLVRC